MKRNVCVLKHFSHRIMHVKIYWHKNNQIVQKKKTKENK